MAQCHLPTVMPGIIHPFSLQALPMVTIIVGSANGSETTANVVTTTENITETEKQVSFDVRSLSPGSPPKYE